MDDEGFYNYFPTDTGPTDYGQTVTLAPFVVNENGGSGTIEDGATFGNDFDFDTSGANPLSNLDETLSSWWDSFVSGISDGLNKPATQSNSRPSTAGGNSSGNSSSTNKQTSTATSSTFSNTGITPTVLIAMGALILVAVYIGRNSK